MSESRWKRKFEALVFEVQDLAEKALITKPEEIGKDPLSWQKEPTIYVSNDWDVCDNLEYAQQHYGKKKFAEFKMTKRF